MASTKNIRVTESSYRSLAWIAETQRTSLARALEDAIEAKRRQLFLQQAHKAYAELRANDDDWKQEQTERRQWDYTLTDGNDA